MNFLDVLAVIVLLISTVTACLKGFALELISLGGVIGGIVLAVMFYPDAAQLLLELELHPMAADFIGFLSVFLATILAASFLGGLTRRAVKALKLSWFDRILGAAFGLVRGCLINIVIFLAFVAFPINNQALEGSRLRAYFLPAAQLLTSFAPADFEQKLMDGLESLRKGWQERGGEREPEPREESI